MRVEAVLNIDETYIIVRNDMHDEDTFRSVKLCGGVLDVTKGSKENLAKKLEESEDGSQRYNYVKLGPDHWRHAANYLVIANSQMANSVEIFAGSSLIAAESDW